MSDLIDRDALKKAIGKVYASDWDDIEKNFHFAEAVNSLPSAEPERKKGKWVEKEYYVCDCYAKCDQCHKSVRGIAEDKGFGCHFRFYSFCPNCGADMRGE